MPKKLAREKQPTVPPEEKKEHDKRFAELLVTMPWQSAKIAAMYAGAEPVALMAELTKQIAAVNEGDTQIMEGLLVGQVHTLNILFHRLLQRAHVQENMHYIEGFTKLALRAQMQCARTLEILSTIKNPPNVAFVKQANIAHNQQVSNGVQASPTPASKTQVIDSTLQLEHINGNYLDTGTATTARGNDPAMASLGEINRTKDR